MPAKIHLDLDILRELIEVKKLRQFEAAKILGVHECTVWERCKTHHIQTQPRGDRKGPDSAQWRGGRKQNAGGYWMVYSPEHPRGRKDGWILEHRLEMEKKIGRLLAPKEEVHHLDGNPQNNHPDNLILFRTSSEHQRLAHAEKSREWVQKRKEGWLRYYNSLTDEQKAERHRKLHKNRDAYYQNQSDEEAEKRREAIRQGIAKSRHGEEPDDCPQPQTTSHPIE